MTNTLLEFLVPLWVTLAIAFSLLWFALRNQSKYEMVDAFWAWSLGVCAIVICIFSEGHELRKWLMASLTSLWAIRLGGFLFWGRIKKGITDGRYENWIKEMGNKVDIKMFIFFQIQALSVLLLSITFMAVCSAKHAIGYFDILAILLFFIALFGEWEADKTLNQFRLNPTNKGKVCNIGLWSLSRHPNYFFEWLHWLSYPLLCIGSSPEVFISMIGPLSLLILILKVSGIPLTEAQAIRSRGQAYKDYQLITPAFFPSIFRKKIMIELAEKGLIPTPLIRMGIRNLIKNRLKEEVINYQKKNYTNQFIQKLETEEIAVNTDDANEQHYEVPSEFFVYVLGKHKKYSGCYWDNVNSLDAAEADALRITCERAEIVDGMAILELGCGWGSLSLWMAEHYPNSKITSISNSSSQRKYIENQCRIKGFNNLTVITKNVVEFQSNQQVDRIVSFEMFEHMRNYKKLFFKIDSWLKPGGKLFVHIFSHQKYSYLFETEGSGNWMGKYFFTGGIMPSKSLLKEFMAPLELDNEWTWNGIHYQKTAEAWHENMKIHKTQIMNILEKTYGVNAKIWYHRWRIFFLACAELFGYNKGEEWDVSHYLFRKRLS